MNATSAYDHCETITKRSARNFYYGIALLPSDKRKAMCALYAMARRIDDIGDGAGAAATKLDALAEVRKDLANLNIRAHDGDPVLTALSATATRFPVPMSAFEELVEGCEMDVQGAAYATFDELVGYCRRVAGSVGRLSLAVYGTDRPDEAEPLADALGIALQLTNILRDLVEDRDSLGRVYLPLEDRQRFAVDSSLNGTSDALIALICLEAARAQDWFDRGLRLLPLLDHRSRAATAAMAGIYRRLLVKIERDPSAVLRGRLSLKSWQKAGVAASALLWGKT